MKARGWDGQPLGFGSAPFATSSMSRFPTRRAPSGIALLLAMLLSCLAPACGSEAGEPTGYDPTMPPATVPHAMLTSVDGTWDVALWVFPEPARKGTNDVVFRVLDRAGGPADDLSVGTQPWMPAHGHGTATVPAVTALGDGFYWAMPVSLYMAGRWELRTTITGDVTDRVVFVVDVR
jgi:hypothetical protein